MIAAAAAGVAVRGSTRRESVMNCSRGHSTQSEIAAVGVGLETPTDDNVLATQQNNEMKPYDVYIIYVGNRLACLSLGAIL